MENQDIKPQGSRFAIAFSIAAIVLSPGLGVFAAKAAPKPPVGTIKVATFSEINNQRTPLSGVTVYVAVVGSTDHCLGGDSLQTGSAGTGTFTSCQLTHGTGKTKTEKYIVRYVAKSGYFEAYNTPIKVGSGRFTVKTGATTSIRLYLVKVATGFGNSGGGTNIDPSPNTNTPTPCGSIALGSLLTPLSSNNPGGSLALDPSADCAKQGGTL